MESSMISDRALLDEIDRRFKEEKTLIDVRESMTKQLLKLNEEDQRTQEGKTLFRMSLPIIDDKGIELSTGLGSNESTFDSSAGTAES